MNCKKLNLLPLSVKNKYANKYLIYATSLICGICILALFAQYINICILNYDIQKIGIANAKYNEEKSKIELLQNAISEYKVFLDSYENDNFPFSIFMHDVEQIKPYTISIISIDSKDRLVNEGISKTEESTTNESSTKDNPNENQDSSSLPEVNEMKLEYKKDLCGEEIVIRGYGQNSADISEFIYHLSRLSYIEKTEITAIEQHNLNDEAVSIFEVRVIGGVAK